MVPEAEETQVLLTALAMVWHDVYSRRKEAAELSHCLSETPAIHFKGPVCVSITSTEPVVALQLESAKLGVPSSVDPAEDHAISAFLQP